jgi:hypothetical protein
MVLLLRTLLQLLNAINSSANKEKLQPFAEIDFFSRSGVSLWQYIANIKFTDSTVLALSKYATILFTKGP